MRNLRSPIEQLLIALTNNIFSPIGSGTALLSAAVLVIFFLLDWVTKGHKIQVLFQVIWVIAGVYLLLLLLSLFLVLLGLAIFN